MELGIRVKCLRNPKEIHETLYRMGIPRMKDRVLWPSCHLKEINGEYYIMHFKECFLLENSHAVLEENDYQRRNKIIHLLEEKFNMIEVIDDREKCDDLLDHVFILRHSLKKYWSIRPKYRQRYEEI